MRKNIMSHSRLKTVIAGFAMTCASATSANAASSEELDLLHNMMVNSYYSVNGFYNFSANQADKEQKQLIDGALEEVETIFESLESESADFAVYEDIEGLWDDYKGVLKQNIREVVKLGYPDLRLAGDMAETNIGFNDAVAAIYKEMKGESGVSEVVLTAREAERTIALMMTKYSARTTSTVSQVYTGGDSEITIDSLAVQFEGQLDKLSELLFKDKEAFAYIESARTKWDFIKNSYVNYNENRVNFIVNLYSKKIIDDIAESVKG